MAMARSTIELPKYGRARPGRGGTTRFFWEPGPGLRKQGYKVERLYRADGIPIPAQQFGLAVELLTTINKRVAEGAEPSEIHRIARGRQGVVELAPPPRGAVAPGTIHDVIRRYKAHWRFRDLRASTRRVYLQSLDLLGRWAGDKHVTVIDGPMVQELYAGLRSRPYVAHAAVRILSIVLQFAKRDLHLIDDNPAREAGLRLPKAPDKRIWSPAEVPHMDATACRIGLPAMGLAIAVNHWFCQRQGDIITLPVTAWRPQDGGDLTVREQSKTGARATLPLILIPGLPARLDAYRAALRHRWHRRPHAELVEARTLFVDDETGRPWDGGRFYRQFRRVREAAARTMPSCADLQFKHLRHSGMTVYADAGVDSAGIAAISGHEIGSIAPQERILGTYIAKTREQAITAVRTRLAYEEQLAAEAATPLD